MMTRVLRNNGLFGIVETDLNPRYVQVGVSFQDQTEPFFDYLPGVIEIRVFARQIQLCFVFVVCPMTCFDHLSIFNQIKSLILPEFHQLGNIIVLVIVTCKNLQKSGQDTPPQMVEEQAPAGPSGWKASHVIEGNNPDSAGTLQIKTPPRYVEVPWQSVTPPNSSRRAYLATGWWYPIMAFQLALITFDRQKLAIRT